MDDNEVSGIFDAMDTESNAHTPVEPKSGEPTGEEPKVPETNTDKETNTESEKQKQNDQIEEGQESPEAKPTEGEQPKPTESEEPSKTETNTETKPVPEVDWKATLPPPPPEQYQGKVPEYDEDGNITNMNRQEYEDYLVGKAEHAADVKAYSRQVELTAITAAEQILPEIRTNPGIRQMVENARIASVLTGNAIDSYEAAKQVREVLGLGTQALAEARAEGAKSAKISIQEQDNAKIDTGASQPSKTEDQSKEDDIVKRVKRGDDGAFVELLSLWEEQNKI